MNSSSSSESSRRINGESTFPVFLTRTFSMGLMGLEEASEEKVFFGFCEGEDDALARGAFRTALLTSEF